MGSMSKRLIRFLIQCRKLSCIALVASIVVACGGEKYHSGAALDAPTFNSAPAFISENNVILQENVVEVVTVTARDRENDALVYSIEGNTDADRFEIDSRTGVLRFREAPDFETPRDSNANNTYVVDVCAVDGTSTTRQTVAVTVVDDTPTVVAPAGFVGTLEFSWRAVKGVTHYQYFGSSDGVSGYRPLGVTLRANETKFNVPVRDENGITYRFIVLEGYDNSRVVYRSDPKDVGSRILKTIGYFKASNTDASDQFGSSVAMSADGQTLVVGAPGEASAATGIDGDQGNNMAERAGAVYVYTRNGAAWTQRAYIKASNTESGDNFGLSVALSADGRILVVGAPGEGSAATGVDGDQGDNTANAAGAVYVFTLAGAVWTQQAYIKASNTDAFDRFGTSVALSADGQTLVAGAPGEDNAVARINSDQNNNAADEAGAAYVFMREGEVWAQQAYLKASNTGAIDKFGTSVALSVDGQTLVAGAPGEASAGTGVNGDQDDNTAVEAGAVFVYTRTGAVWSQQAYLKASNTEAYDYFGSSVALSADGQTLVAGASGESSTATGIDGDQSDNTAVNAGAMYVYTRAGEVWTQQAYLKASNTETQDYFGSSVALSADGNTVVVGAPEEDSGVTGIDGDQRDNTAVEAGAVYVYARAGQLWTQQAFIKASNTEAGDYFGSSVALSAEGQTLAVGAQWENSAATGVGGDQYDNTAEGAGAAYLYLQNRRCRPCQERERKLVTPRPEKFTAEFEEN